MAIIVPPAPLPLRRVSWRLSFPAQVNRSGWTSRRKVVGLPGASMWTASGEFVPQVGENRARAWRGFFAALRGQANSFPLRATERAQFAPPETATVFGDSGAGAGTIQLLGPVYAPQINGDTVIAVGDQTYSLAGPTYQGGGANLRVATLSGGLRVGAPHGTPVTIGVAALYNNVAAGATSLVILGTVFERQLVAGEMLTIAGQLVVLTRDSLPAGGANLRSVAFEPELRQPLGAGTLVERARPFALMALTSEPPGWDVDVGQVYTFPFACEEAL